MIIQYVLENGRWSYRLGWIMGVCLYVLPHVFKIMLTLIDFTDLKMY